MNGQRDGAIRAFNDKAAGMALRGLRDTAAVQKQRGLLFFIENVLQFRVERVGQPKRETRRRFFALAMLVE